MASVSHQRMPFTFDTRKTCPFVLYFISRYEHYVGVASIDGVGNLMGVVSVV